MSMFGVVQKGTMSDRKKRDWGVGPVFQVRSLVSPSQVLDGVYILYRILKLNVVAAFSHSSTSGKIDVWCDSVVIYTSVGEN